MTVEVTTYYSGPYITNGATTVFPFSFISMDADELGVLLRDADGADTVVSTSLYSVTRAANGTGSVVFSSAPASGSDLYIFSDVSFAQSVEFEDGSGWKAAPVNSVADRSAARDIWLKGKVGRALVAPLGETGGELPSVDNRVGKYLAWDAEGNPVAADGTGPDGGLRADLAASGGAALTGFIQSGAGGVARSVQSKVRELVSVKDYGAAGDGTTDDSSSVQAAIDFVNTAGGGVVWFPLGTFLCNTPLELPNGVLLRGSGREGTIILKDSTTTKNFTITASALVTDIYAPGTLPSALNAVIVLTGSGGRYTGGIEDLAIEGTYATALNYESQKVEFGIVSVGSVSDFTLRNCAITAVQYGAIFPVIFASTITQNRISDCLYGLGIDGTSTSTAVFSNYANNCRTYGFYFRALHYSLIYGNACDFLNLPSRFPTRTRTCAAYTFRSCRGTKINNNGQEQTYGRNYRFIDTVACTIENNINIGIGSDYTGTDEIAFIYSDYQMSNCTVRNNYSWSYKASGLISGGANAAKHHNIYFEGQTFVSNNDFDNNIVANSNTGVPIEAGYGNNVPASWANAAFGGRLVSDYETDPVLTANTPGDLAVTYNSGNKHYNEVVGKLIHIFGCFDVTITYTTASSFLIFSGFPTNSATLWKIGITGVEGGSGLAKKLGSFRLNASGTSGIAFDETDATYAITDIPTGTTLQIFYDGWYRRDV